MRPTPAPSRQRQLVAAFAAIGALAMLSVPERVGLAAPASSAVSPVNPVSPVSPVKQDQAPTRHEFRIEAGSFAFQPAELRVRQDDLVKIVFHAADMPHSFTIDSYRIAKRASAGQTVVFEFRADQSGRFPFYCSLKIDDKCAQMKGELVVQAR
jgi:heme/copper-type cytochrome/quinol oxidase subunit 2